MAKKYTLGLMSITLIATLITGCGEETSCLSTPADDATYGFTTACGEETSRLSTPTYDATYDFTAHVEEVATPPAVVAQLKKAVVRHSSEKSLAETIVAIEQIINLGKEIWTIIEENQPVMNIQYDYANALPKGVERAEDLDGFSDLQYKSMRFYGINTYGMTVYDVTYTAVHQYGGNFNGKGRYLATVSVIPIDVSVVWGYTVNYQVTNVQTTNVGTAEDPVASLVLEAKFNVSTVVMKKTITKLFQFRGDSAEVIEAGCNGGT